MERYAALPWRLRTYESEADAIVIGACPRSGTTLLRRILDTHSDICCGPESSLLLPGRPNPAELALGFGLGVEEIRDLMRDTHAQAEFADRFMAAYAASVGTRRWAEKTPLNIRHLDWIWHHFPKARFIHVIRDGRDTVSSMRTHATRRLVDGQWQRVPQDASLESLVLRWQSDVRRGIARRGDRRYHEVRYEDLVGDPGRPWNRSSPSSASRSKRASSTTGRTRNERASSSTRRAARDRSTASRWVAGVRT